MSEAFKLKGICICGHDPEEDPNGDCERCWLVSQIHDLNIRAAEDKDFLDMLRDERDRLREALEFTRGHFGHLMDVWGQEGVTRTVCDKIAAALEPRP